ncbi:MAG TPA: OmpA family protein [Methylomirabilota bacterium]|jgi:outer membrane protein OmpA-like peptidoglycan-associated protein|nr:OmpA family protein [Methylomirabilota bacterium]
MRKWMVFVAMGVLLALPLCAQQKDAGTANNGKGTDSTNAVPGGEFNIAPASPTLFAMPAPPAKPADVFSDWSNNPWNRHAWGQLTPRFEVAGMFSYINFCPCTLRNFNELGATGSLAYNVNRWVGIVGEVGTYRFDRQVFVLDPTTNTQVPATFSGNMQTYLFGPRLNLRRFDHFVPFAEVLFGAAHASSQMTGASAQGSFAMAAGGGVDVVLIRYLTWRFFEADYLMTNFSGPLLSPSARQNNFRIGTGLVIRWAYPPAPPKPNHPPVAACSAAQPSVYEGTTAPVAIHVNATDADNDALTYTYSATGGTVDGTGPDARWNPSGLAIGNYTVNAKVDDGRGGTASCATDVAVAKRPNQPPVISCAPDSNPINAGQKVNIVSTASDPDGDPLNFSYVTSGGQISGTGPTASFDSTGLAPGNYSITCTADDGRGGRTSAPTTVTVQEPPEIKQLESRLSLHDIYFPTAQPTVARPNGGILPSQQKTLEALVSDFARYLTFRPDAHLILAGHADIRGTKEYNMKLSERRVERVKSYLVEHGVPADHLDTKALGEEHNMTAEEVKALVEQDPTLTDETRQKVLKNLPTIVLANNRRVDVTLSTTGQQGVRGLPFNAEDASTLIRRGVEETKKTGKPAAKPAPKPAPKP